MRIAVIGGSGLVGAQLVNTLRHRRHEVLAASSRTGVNTVTGEGLAAAVAGSSVVVDVTNSRSFDDTAALEFFQTSCRNLIAAAEAARVKHHITLSIVGTDRLLESGYFRAKMIQEDLLRASLVPHTILRSTQFFEFVQRIACSKSDQPDADVHVSPAFIQPIASEEVAAALADLATASPRNGMLEAAGPERFRLDQMVRHVRRIHEDQREVITDPRARYYGALLNEDTLTPDEGAILGVTRFEEWVRRTLH
jgi:uncharacterized protein YbjT (DUF2867 family)